MWGLTFAMSGAGKRGLPRVHLDRGVRRIVMAKKQALRLAP
jgi:hypothetical protein